MEHRETDIVRDEPDGTTVHQHSRSVGGEPVGPAIGPEAETEVVSGFSPARRAYEITYLLFAIIEIVILIRVLLKVLGASVSAAFTGFIYGVSDAFLGPFHGVLPTVVSGRTVFEWSAILALIVYGLIGYVLARLVAIMFRRNVTVSQSRGYRPRPE